MVLADGYHEWRTVDGRKQPTVKNGEPFAMAGIYAREPMEFDTAEKKPVNFAILTTTANDAVSHIHDRMPVIPPLGREKQWLPPKYHHYEVASTAIQIGIVLASATVITGMMLLTWLALGLRGIGIAFTLIGSLRLTPCTVLKSKRGCSGGGDSTHLLPGAPCDEVRVSCYSGVP